LDQPIRQQSQRPALLPVGRCTANSGNQERFRRAVEVAGFAMGLLAPVERALNSQGGKASAHVLHRGLADFNRSGNGRIVETAVITSSIRQQENAGAFALPFGASIGAGEGFDLLSLLLSQRNVMFLGRHGWVP
jgi:hypothetical protein